MLVFTSKPPLKIEFFGYFTNEVSNGDNGHFTRNRIVLETDRPRETSMKILNSENIEKCYDRKVTWTMDMLFLNNENVI